MSRDRVLVLGAGLVGCVAATYLADRGYRVTLVERHPDLRDDRLRSGRSINLTLCDRGWRALAAVAAEEPVRQLALPAYGRDIHHADGSRSVQPYGTRREAIWSISRNELNRALLDVAESRRAVDLRFGWTCREVDLDAPAVVLEGPDGTPTRLEADHLVATDGAFSPVRKRMQRQDRFQYSQHFVAQGYKELHLPAGPGGRWRLDPKAIHIWPRGRHMLIAFANLDGSFTLSLHLPFEGEAPCFDSLATRKDVEDLLLTSFPDLAEDVPDLAEQFQGRPVSSMVTVRCSPWSRGGKVILLGDAAHAIVPSYGQGANSGFEDCYLFDRSLDEHGDDWDRALPEFERRRKPDTDAIAEISLDHFREIGDRVGDEGFLRRKEVERALSALYDDFVPIYEAISFTHVPYRRVREQERQQRELIERILAHPDLPDDLTHREARRILEPLMDSYRERCRSHDRIETH